MQYIPNLTDKEIEQNHQYFAQRISLYKSKGLDFLKSRRFILKKAGPLGGNILEIGTGTGHTTLVMAGTGYEFSSIDKDKEVLKTAALNLAYQDLLSRVKFYIMDGMSLTFADHSFENVVIVNLFHHIDVMDKLLYQADRVLRPDGKFILADFNERGMKIVESIHRREGRIHENSGIHKDYVYSYFQKLRYEIKAYEDKFHWALIIKKII
ncbi:MAG: class I SAM-dependent methyltransferase [Candidatus Omnitrophica bacterium]|nr:class I SAM-dependent methyltransferase [Candidatus Omnitrophota bacterium]